MNKVEQKQSKKNNFWQRLKNFFTIHSFDDNDLKAWKKKNYESRRPMGYTSQEEDEEYNKEYDRKNSSD